MRLSRGSADASSIEGVHQHARRQRHQAKGPYCPLGVLRPIHLLFT